MDFKKTALQLRGYFSTPGRQLLLFSLIHFLILLVWLNFSAFDIRIHPDVELYLEYADFMFEGNLPYRDFIVEYPPLSLLFLLIPRLFSANLAGYADAFAVLIFVFALLGLFFTSRLSRKLELNHFATLGIYTLAFFLIGDIAINRFDVIPAVLSLGAVCYYLENKPRAAWFMLALGVLVKLYPAIIAPIFAIGHIRRREFRP
ncbi:MAG: glycosyltransferase 87 family protein, partial [Dehalococcoidales bacterium]